MSTTIKILVDPKASGSEELMSEWAKQVEALDAGEMIEEKSLPPEGTLASPDPATLIIILKASYWSIKLGRALLEIAQEARERIAARKAQPIDQIPRIYIVAENGEPIAIDTSAGAEEQHEFLEKIRGE
jgi:hypothetical protein